MTTKRSRNCSVDLGCSVSQLALAWLAVKPVTSTVILGASKPEQILDNLKALSVVPKLTSTVLERIEKILDNKPVPRVSVAVGGLLVSSSKYYFSSALAHIWKTGIARVSS